MKQLKQPKQSMREIAYEYLCESIMAGTCPSGTPLVEQEISDSLGISRTPVREALKQLEAEGLVQHYRSRGNFVMEITAQDVEGIYDLRESLELLALRRAINKIEEKDILDLEQALHSLGPDSSEAEYYECDRRLHGLIFEAADNRWLSGSMGLLQIQVERLRRVRRSRLPDSQREHLELMSAIKKRDLQMAELRLRVHLNNIKLSLLESDCLFGKIKTMA